MKLSELVAYRNQIDMQIVNDVKQQAQSELTKVIHLVESQSVQLGNHTETLKEHFNEINLKFDQFRDNFYSLKDELDKIISEVEKPYFSKSYELYKGITKETDEQILNRRLTFNQETDLLLRARLKRYSSWKYPGMIIRPGLENFIDDLVMFDPLYLIDIRHTLLDPVMQKFTPEYRRRLRPYVITESEDHEILEKIPNGQFGFCFSYHFFNFKPFEIIKQYLEEIYQKLRPGGVLIMTFNDCDRAKAVILTEMNYSSYTPGNLVVALAERIGYEVLFKHHDDGPNTWIEFKKPGDLTSLRGGQTLAKIKIKKSIAELHFLRNLVDEFQLVEKDKRDLYTAEELKEIIIKSGRKNLLEPIANSK